MELVLHECGEARSDGELRELLRGALDLARLEENLPREANLAEVVRLEREIGHGLVKAA